MMSGWRLGTVGLTAELAALVLLLPLSNCVEKKFVAPSVGKTTELGTNCLRIFERDAEVPPVRRVI